MSTRVIPNYFELPSAPRADIILNPRRSYVSVIKPEESINLVADPEFLAFASGIATYDAIGTLLTPVTNRQRRGLYSCHVSSIASPGVGISYSPAYTTIGNEPYTFSADHFGHGQYLLAIVDRASQIPHKVLRFVGKGFWQRVEITFLSASALAIDLQILTEGGLAGAEYTDGFYTDGWQWEKKPYATTFISGALAGFQTESPNPYGWIGPPHNSASFRRGTTRSGGHEVPLSDLGFHINEIEGLGMGEFEHQIQSYALDHGGILGCSRMVEREFSLSGVVCGVDGIVDLHCTRRNLSSAFSPLFGKIKQPVRLGYQLYECDEPVSGSFYIDCVYDGGLEMTLNNPHTERIDIDLMAVDPFVYEAGASADSLNLPDTFLDATSPGIPTRGVDGGWSLTTPQNFAHVVRDLEVGPEGYMYALTGFGSNTFFQYFDGFEWHILLNFAGVGNGLASTPDGGIYIVGDFSIVAPVVANSVMRYDVATGLFSNLDGTTVTSNSSPFVTVAAAVYHPSGKLIIGGAFDAVTNGSGALTANNVAAYNIATEVWENLGVTPLEGLPDNTGCVFSLVVSGAGNIFAGGRFSANYPSIGYTMENLAYFDIDINDRWRFVDDISYNQTYNQATVYALRFAPNGFLYVGGRFNDTFANQYTSTYGDTSVSGTPHPITNIGYFTELAGDLSGLAGNAGPIIPRMRAVQNGVAECFCQGAFPVDDCASQPGTACPGLSILRVTHVYDIAISCDGDIWIAGDFASVWGERFDVAGLPGGVLRRINAVGVARISQNQIWVPTDIVFAPNTYNIPDTPFFAIQSIEFGSRCDPLGFIGLPGLGLPGPEIPGNDTGAPADYADSLFVGIIIDDTEAPYVLFPVRTTIDTRCSEDAKPVIRVQGPGRLRSISNTTIGVSIDFNDYLLIAGEILTIDLSGRIPRIYSNRAGRNAYESITNLAQIGQFYLISGENDIDITMNIVDDTGAILLDGQAWIEWIPRYISVDAACAAECQR